MAVELDGEFHHQRENTSSRSRVGVLNRDDVFDTCSIHAKCFNGGIYFYLLRSFVNDEHGIG
jgi:hypothetical protein